MRQEQLKQNDKDSSSKKQSDYMIEGEKPEEKKTASAKNIFSAARSALGNFANFMSKKNIDPAEEEKSSIKEPPNSPRSIEQDMPYVINVITTSQEEAKPQR